MRLLISFFLFCLVFTSHVMACNEKNIYGYIEKATFVDKNLTLPAKLDTGAKSASLNATHIKSLNRDGKTYLTFTVPSKEGDVFFQCEYVGDVKIKARAGERTASLLLRKTITRPVVMMNIRLKNQVKTIKVNLTNRKHFSYPLLLGRDAINAFDGIVDPSQKYTLNMDKTDV